MTLHAIWWFGSGAIAYNIVEPHTFLSVIGFLILWFVIRYVPLLIGAGGCILLFQNVMPTS
jgi:hypothetical protein